LVSKIKRSKVTNGPTIREATGCGNLYVTVNANGEEGSPVEVIARLGRSGGCTYCQNEALTRAITVGLKYGAPMQEFIKELKGIRCNNPYMWPEEDRTLSCPDAIAKALEEYLENGQV